MIPSEEYTKACNSMEGRFHSIYMQLGATQNPRTGNFNCWNKGGHSDGHDEDASLTVSNENGTYYCHCCQEKGNILTYYRTRIAKTEEEKKTSYFVRFAEQLTGVTVSERMPTVSELLPAPAPTLDSSLQKDAEDE